jgi:DedD protein
MAFFKFRKAGEEPAATPAAAAQPESVEVMRRRAMHRLLGAAVLVLAGVVGFPVLFDRQPRPIPVDTPIEIPDRNKAAPLSIPAPAARTEVLTESASPSPANPALATASAPAPAEKSATASDAGEEVVLTPAKPASAASKDIAPKAASVPAASASGPVKPASAPGAAAASAPPQTKPTLADGRFVVQVGAFAEVARAREARLKVEAAGLKTYTQVVETKDGRRIRVRVGPFAGKTEADKAAEAIRKLGLSAAILTL